MPPASSRSVKPTTVRLDPAVHAGLVVLSELLEKPLNKLVNEAVQSFVEKRSREVEVELQHAIERLRALREQDPDFESEIARFADAESSSSGDDPVEGTLIDDESESAPVPAQTLVHDILRG
jgi:hypothetical protein